jgi:prepilin-type N-terminal cleavage/methylation domain-containing protein
MTRLNMSSKDRGVTLIELLIALVISSILIAAVYRTFIGQQKTYTVQEQVVDMQQNVRVAINKMMREIRMANFGNVSSVFPVNGFGTVITPDLKSITIVGGFKQIKDASGNPILTSSTSGTSVTLGHATDEFDGAAHRYISIGGLESNTVHSRAGAALTLDNPLKVAYPAGTPVFKVQALTYSVGLSNDKMCLRRDENTGGGAFAVAENIENVQFEYYDGASPPNLLALPIADPGKIRMIRVTLTAKTNMADPELLKTGDGYRRRTIASNIQVRNMGISP